MDKKVFYILILLFVLIPSKVVFAAPAAEQTIVNTKLNLCGVYWPGDEYSYTPAPSGWEVVDYEARYAIETPYGNCENLAEVEACCENMGFEYVEREELPYPKEYVIKFNEGGWLCNPDHSSVQNLLINEDEGKCAAGVSFHLRKTDGAFDRSALPTEGQCDLLDDKWEGQGSSVNDWYETQHGRCDSSNPRECCTSLGFAYVGELTYFFMFWGWLKYLIILIVVLAIAIFLVKMRKQKVNK